MIAFVLSGGGSRGALQVGAVQVLLEHGIRPDILVGTSAGAINAAYLAVDPTPERAQELADLWLRVRREDVYPGGRLRALWRVLTGHDSLYPNDHLRAFIEAHIPPESRRFGDIHGAKLYIVATRLDTGLPHIFGEDPDESVVDAIMASTALPPMHPPWEVDGVRYIDGGTVAALPVGIAADKGAREIYALHILDTDERVLPSHALLRVVQGALDALVQEQWTHDLEEVARRRRVRLHHIPLSPGRAVSSSDFRFTWELIQIGRRTAEAYLETWRVPRRWRAVPLGRAQLAGRATRAFRRLGHRLLINRAKLARELQRATKKLPGLPPPWGSLRRPGVRKQGGTAHQHPPADRPAGP